MDFRRFTEPSSLSPVGVQAAPAPAFAFHPGAWSAGMPMALQPWQQLLYQQAFARALAVQQRASAQAQQQATRVPDLFAIMN